MKITNYLQEGFTVLSEAGEQKFTIKNHVRVETNTKTYVGILRSCESAGINVTCIAQPSVAPGCYLIPTEAIVSITKIK